MPRLRREQIWQRADNCCEYCRMPQAGTVLPHTIDHVRPYKHRGSSALENLCLACTLCNAFKGPNIAGYDPLSNVLTRLFNPRSDEWSEHFEWDGPLIVATTDIGRTTVEVLRLNSTDRVEHRRILRELGRLPT